MIGEPGGGPGLDVTSTWCTAVCSVIGAAHRRSGMPYQDAATTWTAPDQPAGPLLIAVADGHGGRRYVRSDRGARLACQVAEEVGLEMSTHLEQLTVPGRDVRRWLERDLARLVTGRWRLLVVEDLRRDPLDHLDETTVAAPPDSDADPSAEHQRQVQVYGTTLLFALLSTEVCVFFRLGDGEFVVLGEHGTRTYPAAPVTEMLGVETYSLAMADAWRYAQVDVLPTAGLRPRLVLAATDGLTTSFTGSDGLDRFVDGVDRIVGDGASAQDLHDRLAPVLDRYTDQGTGDDISVVIAWHLPTRDEMLWNQTTIPT